MPIAVTELSERLAAVVENTGKSVVRVEGGRRPRSGVAWAPTQVVTVSHGLEREVVTVGLDGRTVSARVRGRDPSTDLALLEVDGGLEPAPRSPSTTPRVGELVLALARPGQTVRATSGIVSVVGREPWRTPRGGRVDFFLESDAPHQPGFSGGPLVDLEGRVLGLSTSGVLRGSVVVLPRATVERVVAQLAQHGRVRRSFLGATLQPVKLPADVRERTGEEVGLLVTAVAPEGPAAQAGVRFGDTLLRLGDEQVKTLDDFFAYLRDDHVGEAAAFSLYRDGQIVKGSVTLGAR